MIKKLYRFFIGSILLLLFLFYLTACTQTTNPKEIMLGVAWPFASDQSLFEEGIDLAVEEINEDGGIGGQKLMLLKMDDASSATVGMAAAKSFSENESVRAVIGHKNSYISVPASAIYEEAGLVMLSPASTAPELTQNNGRFIFRIIPSDARLAQNVAEYLGDQGLERIVLYYTEDSYGKGLADAFEDQSLQYGITVVDRFQYYSGMEELKRLQNRWRAFGYDGIFVAAAISEGSQFIYDVGQAGIRGLFAGGNALDSSKLSEIDGVGEQRIIIGSVFDPKSSEKAKSFTQSFTEKYGHAPDMYAALGYDAVRILADALNNSKSYDRGEIAKELRSMGRWEGVCGEHGFSETGDEVGELVVLKQLQNGKFSRLER